MPGPKCGFKVFLKSLNNIISITDTERRYDGTIGTLSKYCHSREMD